MFVRSYFFGTDTRMTMTTASRAMTSQYFQLPLSLRPTMRTFCVVSTSLCVVCGLGRRVVVCHLKNYYSKSLKIIYSVILRMRLLMKVGVG